MAGDRIDHLDVGLDHAGAQCSRVSVRDSLSYT
jgi:hypothetical protein